MQKKHFVYQNLRTEIWNTSKLDKAENSLNGD